MCLVVMTNLGILSKPPTFMIEDKELRQNDLKPTFGGFASDEWNVF